ncbi:MAG: outer membrane protein transport protein, partial [Bacteroidota bacterium]
GNTTRRFALPFEVQGGGEPIADPIFASARLRGSGMGIGGSIGIYFQPSALVSLGLNFRSGTTLDIQEGEANFDVPSSLEQQFPSSTFQTTLQLPGSINFGLGYRPSDELTVTMDANYVLWETTSNTIIEFEETLPNFEYPGSADLGYQNTIVIRMGAEYHLSDDVYVRAGTFFDQSPVTDGFVSPELPDANTVGFTGGVSFQVTDNLGLDMTFQFETTGERTTFFEDRRFGGTYQSNNTVIGLGLVWKY